MPRTDRVLRGDTATVAATFTDYNGVPMAADDGVTVAVVNDVGEELLAGAATKVFGDYRADLTPTATADLDLLTITWSGTFGGITRTTLTRAEVVGGHHVDLLEIRQDDPSKRLEESKYTAQALRRARASWEDLAEDFTGRAFVPRYQRRAVRLMGQRSLLLPAPLRALRWAEMDGAALDVADFTPARNGIVEIPHLSGDELVIGFEHGEDAAPADLADAALTAIREALRASRGNVRALSQINPDGSVEKLSYKGPTQIPSVDQTLMRYRVPAVA